MGKNFDDIARDLRSYKETVRRKKLIDKLGAKGALETIQS